MADYPPQLGEIPRTSELNVPTLSTSIEHDEPVEPTVSTTANGSATMENGTSTSAGFKDAVVNSKVSFDCNLHYPQVAR